MGSSKLEARSLLSLATVPVVYLLRPCGEGACFSLWVLACRVDALVAPTAARHFCGPETERPPPAIGRGGRALGGIQMLVQVVNLLFVARAKRRRTTDSSVQYSTVCHVTPTSSSFVFFACWFTSILASRFFLFLSL
jgi:hypothetical protein